MNESIKTRKFIFYFTFFLIALSVAVALFIPMTITGGNEKQLFFFGISLIPVVALFITVNSLMK